MKKFFIFFALSALILGSCAKNDGPDANGPATLNFKVTAVEPVNTRRAVLYSEQPVQAIVEVKVYAFKLTGTDYIYEKTIDMTSDWTVGSNTATHNLPKSEMFEKGSYRFLSVGLDVSGDYTLPALVAGTTKYTDVIATLATTAPEEIFSGYTDYEIKVFGAETVMITITRRIAGCLGYFINVPTKIGGVNVKYLRLSLVGSNTKVDVTTKDDVNTNPTAPTAPTYNIFNVDLSAQGDANNDGYFDGSAPVPAVAKLEPSTLIGAFLIPVAVTSGNTLTLNLVGEDGTTVLKTWPVKNEANTATYSILSNHLYALGRKAIAPFTDGGTPSDPSDDDAPLDLSLSQAIQVNLYGGWDTTHRMNLN